MASLCDFGFAKYVPSVTVARLVGDPTTCYQPPERWLACHSHAAAVVRGTAAAGAGSGGCSEIPQRDEMPSELYGSDIFSAGVSLFVLVAYEAILKRLEIETACAGTGEGGGGQSASLPALNVFQHSAGGDMFGLLQARTPMGGAQRPFWAYWKRYGLRLSPALRGLLDGVLHPVPGLRFSMKHVFAWMDSNPDMFVAQQ